MGGDGDELCGDEHREWVGMGMNSVGISGDGTNTGDGDELCGDKWRWG